jgi:hypothetical protein
MARLESLINKLNQFDDELLSDRIIKGSVEVEREFENMADTENGVIDQGIETMSEAPAPVSERGVYPMVVKDGKKYYLASGDNVRTVYEASGGQKAFPAGKGNRGNMLYWTTENPRQNTLGLKFEKSLVESFPGGRESISNPDIAGIPFTTMQAKISQEGFPSITELEQSQIGELSKKGPKK